MSFTHYIHKKEYCEGFSVKEKVKGSYREHIKQIQYHRDELWINLLIKQGLKISEVKTMLDEIKIKSCDYSMPTEIFNNEVNLN